MAGGVFARLGGAWRTAVYFDVWDASAGVWRDVREIWGYSFGFWRLHYQRASIQSLMASGSEPLPGDPPTYTVSFDVNGTAAGTVFWEIRISGTVRSSGFVATPGSITRGIAGDTVPETGDVRIFNVRGRLIDTQPLPI